MMPKKPAPAPLASLVDAGDDLAKLRDLVRVVVAAMSGGAHDPEETRNGCLWILGEVEDLAASADRHVDAAGDALSKP